MAYEDNSLVTPEGQEVMNTLFDLIYNQDNGKSLTDETRFLHQPTEMLQTVQEFKKNCPKIVTIMRRFLRGNTHVAYNETADSGIFICDPITGGCGRRDFIWWWEYLDFGIYKDPSEWTSSVGIQDFPATSYAGEKGVLVVARIKCNQVRTCDPTKKGCGTTWRGTGSCPNPECKSKSSAMSKVGCGKEHYAYYWIDTSETWGSYWSTGQYAIEHNGVRYQTAPELPPQVIATIAPTSGFRNQDYGASPFYYRMFYQGLPPTGKYIEEMDEVNQYIPFIQIGYDGEGGTRRPIGYECNKCDELRYAPPHKGKFNVQYEIYIAISNYSGSNYHGDQTGGLCTNIGDTPATYAGVTGNFGCKCGGIFEPLMKLGPVKQSGGAMGAALTQLADRTNRGRQQARILNAIPTSIPISKCRYAFTHTVMDVCHHPDHKGTQYRDTEGNYITANYTPLMIDNRYQSRYKCYSCGRIGNHQYDYNQNKYVCSYCKSVNIKEMMNIEQTDFCPTCGPTGEAAYITPHPQGLLMPPQSYTITASQPLSPQNAMDFSTGEMNEYMGKAQWNLTLVDKKDTKESQNLRIELPQIYLGNVIPDSVDLTAGLPPGGSASRHCPNEAAGPLKAQINDATKQIQKQQKATATVATPAALDDATKLGLPAVCNGINTGYTFIVCEGKSNMGFIPVGTGLYTDFSPECNYGDGKVRPRFTEVPPSDVVYYPSRPTLITKECVEGLKYSWCDVDTVNTQICQDFTGKQNKALSNQMQSGIGTSKISGTHAMTDVSTMKIPQTGVELIRVKCWTCEKIGDIGKKALANGKAKSLVKALQNNTYYPGYGVIRYYQSTGDLKSDADIIKGKKVKIVCPAGSIGESYIEGALEYEQSDITGKGGGWWNWCMPQFKKACATKKDIKIT